MRALPRRSTPASERARDRAASSLALALLAYTYVGYPVAIGAAGAPVRRAAPHGADADRAPRCRRSRVCLPVYNGAAYLPAKIESLLAQDYPADRIEILIYCDGCTDDSERARARELAAAPTAAGASGCLVARAPRQADRAQHARRRRRRGELLLLNDVRQPLSPTPLARAGPSARRSRASAAPPATSCWRAAPERRLLALRELDPRAGVALPRHGGHDRPDRDDAARRSRAAAGGHRSSTTSGSRCSSRSPASAWPSSTRGARRYDTAFEDDREFRRKVRTLAGNYQLFARMPALLEPAVEPDLVRDDLAQDPAAASRRGRCSCWRRRRSASRARGRRPDACARWSAAQAAFYAGGAAGPRAGRLAGVARTFVVLNAAAVGGAVAASDGPTADHLVTSCTERSFTQRKGGPGMRSRAGCDI